MYIFYYLVIIISFCGLSFVKCADQNIFISVTDQNGTTKLYNEYDKNVDITYDVGEFVSLRCSISSEIYRDGSNNATLSWVHGGVIVSSTKSEHYLERHLSLTDAEDGMKLVCKADSDTKQASLSVYFTSNKPETVSKKPNIFWILVISICGFVGGSIIILIIWSLATRICCKNKVKECDTQVIYIEEDLDNKKKNLTTNSNASEYTEIGINNQYCEFNDFERREDFDSDRRNEIDKQNSLYITVQKNKRHGSSTEC